MHGPVVQRILLLVLHHIHHGVDLVLNRRNTIDIAGGADLALDKRDPPQGRVDLALDAGDHCVDGPVDPVRAAHGLRKGDDLEEDDNALYAGCVLRCVEVAANMSAR
jgi:hypothetical protein